MSVMSSVWQGTDSNATVATTAAADVARDTLVGKRVLAMPVPGYGKHNGTVTDAAPGSEYCCVRWDDGSSRRYQRKQVLQYLDHAKKKNAEGAAAAAKRKAEDAGSPLSTKVRRN
jgi:hypothetical protein